jgi:hypothetical protein
LGGSVDFLALAAAAAAVLCVFANGATTLVGKAAPWVSRPRLAAVRKWSPS